MKASKKEDFEQGNALDWKLEGIAAKLHVMAAAFQSGTGGTPSKELTEAALISVAEEVEAARAAFLALWETGKEADEKS